MKKLMATTAILALTAGPAVAADLSAAPVAPAPALPYISAVLSLWAGGAILDSDDFDFNKPGFPTFGGDARIGGQSWLLEIYGSYIGEVCDEDGSECEVGGSTYFAGVGHYLMRDPGSDRAFGIFVGLDATGFTGTDEHSVNVIPGVEAAIHRGAQTYYGQVGGNFCVTGECTDTWETGAFGRAGIRHFFNPDAKLELDALAAWGYFDSSDADGWGFGWGAEYEQQVAGGPFSFFGAYRGTYTEDSSSGGNDATDHTFMVGARARTGGTDLQTDYTDGPSIFNIPGHHFHRFRSFPDEL